MKIAAKILKYGLILYSIVWILFATCTDNQIKCYLISIFTKENLGNFNKVTSINKTQLDSIILSNPNTLFYFGSYYCGYCCKKYKTGNEYDSVLKKQVIYFTVDNHIATQKIDNLVKGNNDINSVYYLSDKYFSGMYHIKGKSVLQKYANHLEWENAYPFILESDSSGKITNVK